MPTYASLTPRHAQAFRSEAASDARMSSMRITFDIDDVRFIEADCFRLLGRGFRSMKCCGAGHTVLGPYFF